MTERMFHPNDRGSGRTYRMVLDLPRGRAVALIVHTEAMRTYLWRMLHDVRPDLQGLASVHVITRERDFDRFRGTATQLRADHAWDEHSPEQLRQYFEVFKRTRRES